MKPEKEKNPWWMEARDRVHLSHFGRHPSRREHIREQLMRDWYGDDARAAINARRRPPRPICDAVDQVLKDLGMSRSSLLESLLLHWPEVVGADVSQRTVPSEILDRKLVIEVSSTSWMYVLKTIHQSDMRQKVQAFTKGKIQDIEFVPQGRIWRKKT